MMVPLVVYGLSIYKIKCLRRVERKIRLTAWHCLNTVRASTVFFETVFSMFMPSVMFNAIAAAAARRARAARARMPGREDLEAELIC